MLMIKCMMMLVIAVPLTAQTQRQPNIIFIMADDLGYGDLGSYGQKYIQTPVLDQMAAEGMRFTDCYSGAPVCAPARSVLMTGLHTGHTRVRGNFGIPPGQSASKKKGVRVPLLPEDVTVAEVLKQGGYVTGMTGKWGLGDPETTGLPSLQGFDHFFGFLNQKNAHTYYPQYLWLNQEKFNLAGNQRGQKTQYTHDLCTEYMLNFVREQHRKPFFLYVPYQIPHSKYEIPSTDPYSDQPWKRDEKVHAAMITLMDRDIGQLFALLKKLRIDDNTIVFFCSDNGAAERWEGRFDSSGALRGRKRDMYEGGIRTPMIVRWPGTVPAGVVSEAAWYFPDVLPTCADLAGVSAPAVDGVSVVPTLLGQPQPALADRKLYWEFFERGFAQAARWQHWKAVRFKGKPLQLYDLRRDIGEKDNISGHHPEVVALFEDYFATERTESEYWIP